MKIGVLALQGAFREHRMVMEALGCQVVEVRKPEHLEGLSGLILPGGESTTIGKLLNDFHIMEPLRQKALEGFPIFGTCAGLILLSKNILSSDQPRLELMDTEVMRNAYGRQVDSFEISFEVKGIEGGPMEAVFIRAPFIERVGPGVQVLAEFDGKIVVAQQGNLLVAAFHPELTEDFRLHEYFLGICKEYFKSKS